MIDIKEKIRNAKKAVKLDRKMYNLGLAHYLRPTEFAGIAYQVREEVINDRFRRIVSYVDTNLQLREDFLDYLPPGADKPISVSILEFHDAPFILTARTAPGLIDSQDIIQQVILGPEANRFMNYKIELEKRNEEVRSLNYVIDNIRKSNQYLEDQLNFMGEELRNMRETVRTITEENSRLRSYLVQLASVAEQYMVGDLEKTSQLEYLISKAQTLGRFKVMDIYDMLDTTLSKMRKIQEQQAFLQPSDIRNLRDIISPEMVKQIAKSVVEELKGMDGQIDIDRLAEKVASKIQAGKVEELQ
jgi:hypothetical protein